MKVAPRPQGQPARKRGATTAVIVVLLILLLGGVASFYTEVLWFQETGFDEVFWTGIRTRIMLGAVFGLAFAVVLMINLWIARKITDPSRVFSLSDQVFQRYRTVLMPYARWTIVLGSIVLGVFAGSGASVQWRNWLLYQNRVDFGGAPDPVFQRDTGFYVFELPFQEFLFTWLFSTLVVIAIVVGVAHYFMGGIRPQARGADRVSPEVRAHLSVLLGLIVLVKAWGYRLDQYRLLYSERGEQVTGASYTDINAELPALRLLVVIAVICSILFFINARQKNWVLPIGGIALLGLTSAIAGGIYPAAVQRIRVEPNEQKLEAPYIVRNIDHTRRAFGINDVESRRFDVQGQLTAKQARANQQTIQNIRLWDPAVLRDGYRQLQRIKQYYEFLDVDVDRYPVGGEPRQVMLGGREIAPADLNARARTWVNEHLVYTHGYGLVASRVNTADEDGRPSFIISNLPPSSAPGAPEVTQPRIYFGEDESLPFAIVGGTQPELDYPQSEGAREFVPTKYAGTGGVALKGVGRRLAFAWRFRDPNILLSNAITAESKILFRRQIAERVRQVAPFVRLDSDPYLVVADGRLVWVIDAYTTSNNYPYSERVNLGALTANDLQGSANYIRNSVKFVIDAEHGSIKGYAWDDQDPILKAWRGVFPDLIEDKAAMPKAVRDHVRYPEDMFRVQTEQFATYHITDPSNFYSKEDQWSVAHAAGADAVEQFPEVEPYYVLLRLPGDKELSFQLVRPFTPNNRQNLSAYLMANSDPDDYGKFVSFEFPEDDPPSGPQQTRALIQGDSVITPQLTLLGAAPSKLIYGNLLIIPIESTLLYVQPMYVTGGQTRLPELKKVVVISGKRVVMADSLSEALDSLFEGRGTVTDSNEGVDLESLLEQAADADDKATAALKRGDFAEFGRQDARRRRLLKQALSLSGGTPQASPSPSQTPTG